MPKPVKGSWADGQDVMGYDADLGREDEEIRCQESRTYVVYEHFYGKLMNVLISW